MCVVPAGHHWPAVDLVLWSPSVRSSGGNPTVTHGEKVKKKKAYTFIWFFTHISDTSIYWYVTVKIAKSHIQIPTRYHAKNIGILTRVSDFIEFHMNEVTKKSPTTNPTLHSKHNCFGRRLKQHWFGGMCCAGLHNPLCHDVPVLILCFYVALYWKFSITRNIKGNW